MDEQVKGYCLLYRVAISEMKKFTCCTSIMTDTSRCLINASHNVMLLRISNSYNKFAKVVFFYFYFYYFIEKAIEAQDLFKVQ